MKQAQVQIYNRGRKEGVQARDARLPSRSVGNRDPTCAKGNRIQQQTQTHTHEAKYTASPTIYSVLTL